MATYRYKSVQRFDKPDGWDYRTDERGNQSQSRRYKPVLVDVELLIDTEGLMQRLAYKALNSKSGKATALHGLIKVKIAGERDAQK